MLTSLQAVLFDLDGVLIDSENEYTRIWSLVEKEFPTGIENFSLKIKGTTLDDILSTYYPDTTKAIKVRKRLYELEGKMVYKYTSGALKLMDSLSEAGIPFALVTSSNDDKMQHLWQQHPELRKKFKAIVDGDMVVRSKPDPEGYVLGAKLLNSNPKDCIVFEDSLQGVKAGKAAGAFVVGVAGTLPETVLRPWADLVISSLEDINIGDLKEVAINNPTMDCNHE